MANFKLNQTGEQIQADLNLLDSNTATQGQVLTANGTGGASWQDASGGGTQLYEHNIMCFWDSSNSNSKMFFNLILQDNTPITNYTTLYTILNNLGFNNNNTNYESLKSATGVYKTADGDEFIIATLKFSVGSNNFLGFVSNGNYGPFGSSSTVRIRDKVVAL